MTNPWADFTFVGVGQKQPEGCRHHRHRQHLRVGDPREGMAHLPQRPHRVVNHHVDPYNVCGGHHPSPLSLLSFNHSEADFDDDR